MIDWPKVSSLICAKLSLDRSQYWGYRLGQILKGLQDDNVGALPIMRALKLDCIKNSLMASGRRGSSDLSHQRALKFAKDFDIPLDQVTGTGANGLILKRDVMAFYRGLANQRTMSLETDSRLLRQRRILSNHLRDCLRTNRSLCGILAATQDRLAATSESLGQALTAKFAAEAALQSERETSARLEGTVRRLSARAPRVRRTTTHVNIAGLTFRNRTEARS